MIRDLGPDVGRVDRVVPPVGDRRDRSPHQKPVPEIPEKGEETPKREPPPPVEDRQPPDGEDDRTVDLLVLPLNLPSRQPLPSADRSILYH